MAYIEMQVIFQKMNSLIIERGGDAEGLKNQTPLRKDDR
jgi:hypothetical protein